MVGRVDKRYIAIIISLVAGFAVAAVTLKSIEPGESVRPATDASAHFDQSAATEERIRALEVAVAEERNARQLLEDELLALYDELDALREVEGEAATPDEPATTAAVQLSRWEAFRQRGRTAASSEARTAALVDAGFSPDRAAWIVQREDELRLEGMQARFEAQRAGDAQAIMDASRLADGRLRSYFDESEYEQYLEAYGRPTTVSIGDVIQSSPGQLAGLQAGDEIVRYDGERVFSFSDVNRAQLQGEPGESVVMDIVRDGAPMQIVLPRGPIGIQAGRFRGR